MDEIKKHEDLLNRLHNAGLEFVSSENKYSEIIFVGTLWKEYIVHFTFDKYAISINKNHAQTVSKNHPYKAVDNILLIVVDTPQAVYDYFKPFMGVEDNE